MTSLWPMFSAPTDRQAGRLPLYRDILMDYEAGRPVWEGGDPVMVTGLEAVKGWAWRAIATARYRYLHFSWSYGCELEALVGQPYRADTKLSEAARYVRDAQISDARFEGSTLHLTVALSTVYGRTALYV